MITEKLKKIDAELGKIQEEYENLKNSDPISYSKLEICDDQLNKKYQQFRDEYERDGSVLLQYMEWASIYGRNGKFGITKFEERSKLAMFDVEELNIRSQNYGTVERINLLVGAIFSIYGMDKRKTICLKRKNISLRFAIPRETLDNIRFNTKEILNKSGETFVKVSSDHVAAQNLLSGIEKFLVSPKTFLKNDGLFESYQNYYKSSHSKGY